MSVSREEVRAVARLARLRLTDEELDRFADQLGAILDHVAALDEAALEEMAEETAEETAEESMTPGAGPTRAEDSDAGTPLRGEEEPPDRFRRPLAEIAPTWDEGFFTVPRLAALDVEASEEGPSGDAVGGGAARSPDGGRADGGDA